MGLLGSYIDMTPSPHQNKRHHNRTSSDFVSNSCWQTTLRTSPSQNSAKSFSLNGRKSFQGQNSLPMVIKSNKISASSSIFQMR